MRDFYRLTQKQERNALGFLMTLYRKRLTSSFYAILEDIHKPISPAPVTPETIEQLFTTSIILRSCGAFLESKSDHPFGGGEANRIWSLTYKGRNVSVTFYPDVFDEMPSLRLMSFEEPLVEELLEKVITKTKN